MKILIILILSFVIIATFDSMRMYLLYMKTLKLETNFASFQNKDTFSNMKILVLGDSTAVGTGATDPKNTTAGRLSSLFPNAALLNISQNGMKIAELNKKMDDINGHYDYILIQIGANDIIRFTSSKDIENGLNDIIIKAKKLSNRVVILHSTDIGKAKFFAWYVRPIYSYRTQNVREIYMRQAEMHTVQYVDLHDVKMTDYEYSDDKLHPNDEGYRLWFDEIKKKIDPRN